MRVARLPKLQKSAGVCLAYLALTSCGDNQTMQRDTTTRQQAAPPETFDPLICGSEPIQPFEPRGVRDIPEGLSREQAEDAVSKALDADARNCVRTASYLFAKAEEPVEIVAKGVVGQCANAVLSHAEHCSSLKWWTGKGVYPLEGQVGSFRLYCGASKEPSSSVLRRLEREAFTTVIRARAGRCWLLPVAKSASSSP